MIISRILGGLGNQMFQYAAGRALSLRLGEPLFLDIGGFPAYRLHQGFELPDVFLCNSRPVTDRQMRSALGWRSYRQIGSLLLKPQLQWLRGHHFVVEPHFHYWSGFNDISDSCYLSGYWQSEKYFAPVEDRIRQDFGFRQPLSGRNMEQARQIAGCSAVSLHVRRGDYLSDTKTSSTIGVCSLDYYRAAVAYIAKQVASPCFFIFSDDIPWCREKLRLDFPCTYIDHNRGTESYRDMQLMSLCRHHIIANSSFSWWGGWLNPRTDKIVIAPKQWFVTDFDSTDLVPSSWIRL